MTPFRFQTAQKNSAYASFFCTAVWKLNDVITMLYYWTMHASLCFNCLLEYNITFFSIEKTGRKPCSIREHIIGIVMVSERDFDNETCVWSYNVYAL